jgi:hypothetical protein
VDFRKPTHKHGYVLASHSHFYVENVYNTPCRKITRKQFFQAGLSERLERGDIDCPKM